MELYIDTANIDEIRRAAALGVLDGVTTNPSLVAKEGVDFHTRLKEICQVVKGPVSAEVVSLEHDGMVAEAEVRWRLCEGLLGAVQMKVMSGEDPNAEASPRDLHRPDADAVGGPQGDPDRPGA